MAPEQAAGSRGQLGPASDVYSLGTILYQMLTGRPPFQAASPVDTVLLVLGAGTAAAAAVEPAGRSRSGNDRAQVPAKAAGAALPERQALADDLRAYLADEPIAARSGVFSQVIARWLRETHHATVLENWGLLWMWHSLALLMLCLVTNLLAMARRRRRPGLTSACGSAGLGTWAAIFWTLAPPRRAGDVRRAADRARLGRQHDQHRRCCFTVEMIVGLPVLTLVAGAGPGQRHGVSGQGRHADRRVLRAGRGAVRHGAWPWRCCSGWQIPLGITLFGVVSAACFFFPGLKYYRQRRKFDRA